MVVLCLFDCDFFFVSNIKTHTHTYKTDEKKAQPGTNTAEPLSELEAFLTIFRNGVPDNIVGAMSQLTILGMCFCRSLLVVFFVPRLYFFKRGAKTAFKDRQVGPNKHTARSIFTKLTHKRTKKKQVSLYFS